MWLGRLKLGDTIRAAILCANDTVPDAPLKAPVLSVYSSGGTKVYSGPLACLDPYGATGLFAVVLRLGASFAEGAYRWAVQYQTSGGAFRILAGQFQIVGSGSAAGNFIAGCFYQRPHANFLVLRSDADARVLARNPVE